MKENRTLRYLTRAMLAGCAISFGCIGNLMAPDALSGAIIFSFGFTMVIVFDLLLYTEVAQELVNPPGGKLTTKSALSTVFKLFWGFAGNTLGCLIIKLLVLWTNLYPTIKYKAGAIVHQRIMLESYFGLFCLGMLCNALIYVAVRGYKNTRNRVSGYALLLFGITTFVISGFEHCVADTFYCLICGHDFVNVPRLLAVFIGNAIGGVCMEIWVKNATKGKVNTDEKYI